MCIQMCSTDCRGLDHIPNPSQALRQQGKACLSTRSLRSRRTAFLVEPLNSTPRNLPSRAERRNCQKVEYAARQTAPLTSSVSSLRLLALCIWRGKIQQTDDACALSLHTIRGRRRLRRGRRKSAMVFRQPRVPRGARHGSRRHGYEVAEFVLGLASPAAFPCPESSPSYDLRFSKVVGGGHYLAFGTEWGKVVIADTRAEALVQRDHHGPVASRVTARVDDGGESIVETEGTRYGISRRWGVGQPVVVAEYQALTNCIFDLEWMEDDRRIALACGDGKCRVQDTETQAEVLLLSGHNGSVKTISVNPLQQGVLLSGSRDGSFALWDTRLHHQRQPDTSGAHRTSASENLGFVETPANALASCYVSPVEQVYRANVPGGSNRKRPWSYVRSNAANEHSRATKTGGKSPLDMPYQSSVTSVHWMPDGQKFLTAGQDGLVKLWDTRYALLPLQAAGRSESSCRRKGDIGSSSASTKPVSSSPALTRRNSEPQRRRGKVVRGPEGWRAGGGIVGGDAIAKEAAADGGRPYGVSSVHTCDDGSRIAVCTVKNHISVYAYVSGSLEAVGAYTGNANNSSYYIKAKLSPDGSMLASGSTNDAVCLWRVDCPGAPIARLTGHVNEVTDVDWCRSEAFKLASCSDDETVRIWTLDPLRVLQSNAPTAVKCRAATRTCRGSTRTGSYSTAVAGTGSSETTAMRAESGVVLSGLQAPPENVDGRTPGGSFSVGGKFGVGIARVGESEWWTLRQGSRAASDPMDVEGILSQPKRYVKGGRSGRGKGGIGTTNTNPTLTLGRHRSLSRTSAETSPVAATGVVSGSSLPAYTPAGNSSGYAIARRSTWSGGGTPSLPRETLVTTETGGSDAVFTPYSPNKKIADHAHLGRYSDSNNVARRLPVPVRLDLVAPDASNSCDGDENAAPDDDVEADQRPDRHDTDGVAHTGDKHPDWCPTSNQQPSRRTDRPGTIPVAHSASAYHGPQRHEAGDADEYQYVKRLPFSAQGSAKGRKSPTGLRLGMRKGRKGATRHVNADGSSTRRHHTLLDLWSGFQGAGTTTADTPSREDREDRGIDTVHVPESEAGV